MREITIEVVRHGEYDSNVHGSGTRAALVQAGRVRAQELAGELIREYSVRAEPLVLVSEYLRAQQTAEPIARAFGVEVRVVDWAYYGPESTSELAEALSQAGTALIILVGHASTIDQMYHLAGSRAHHRGSRPGEVYRFGLALDGETAVLSSKGMVLQP